MRVIHTTAVVTDDGKLLVQAPPDIASGKHKIVLILEETHAATLPLEDVPDDRDLTLPVYDPGTWRKDTKLSRKESYDDWERQCCFHRRQWVRPTGTTDSSAGMDCLTR